jgi:hypothetical protein
MAFDPFFGDSPNSILPKRRSSPSSAPGPLRVPNVQMGQPQVAPPAQPIVRPGASPVQYPAPQTYNRPMVIPASMLRPTPWTQGSSQPFPAPNGNGRLGANRLGRLGQTRSVTGSECEVDPYLPGCPPVACESSTAKTDCGELGQCAGGLCEPLPEIAAEQYTKAPRACTGSGDCYSYEKCNAGLCEFDPASAKVSASSPSGRRRRATYVPPKRAEEPKPAEPTGVTFRSKGGSGEDIIPATGMTLSEMEAAVAVMDDKLICKILTAYKKKQGLEDKPLEYIVEFQPLADRVAQSRKICAYEPPMADIIQLPVSAGRAKEAPRAAPPPEPVSVGTDRAAAASSSASAAGASAAAAAAAKAEEANRAAAAAAEEAAAVEAKALAEAIDKIGQMDNKLICKIIGAAAARQGFDGYSETFIKMLAPYAQAVAEKRGICGFAAPAAEPSAPAPSAPSAPSEQDVVNDLAMRMDTLGDKFPCSVLKAAAAGTGLGDLSAAAVAALAPFAADTAKKRGICGYEKAAPEPAPSELPPATNGGTPSTPPASQPPRSSGGNGGGGGGYTGGGYVDPGTREYGGGGGGGGGGQMLPPPDLQSSRQLVVKQGIPWWVWLLIVGGTVGIAYYAKKKAGLAGHDDEGHDGKPMMIELTDPEGV